MNLVDWREVPAHVLDPLYEAERLRAIQVLQWDTRSAWAEVERARITWGLPGMLALDPSGRVRGLLFYVPDDDRLDIGGIVSDHVAATDALLDGVLEAADAYHARSVRAVVFEGAVALQSGLRIRGFAVEPQLYLSRAVAESLPSPTRPLNRSARPLHGSAPCDGPPFDAWLDTDIEPAAALLCRAYAGTGTLFAPRNQPAEWERYVRNLVMHTGCGTLNRDATCVLREDGQLRALALMTDIGPGVAHLVQLAIDPDRRGQALGRALVDEAVSRIAVRGYTAMTLLVAGSHSAARALYDRAGFRHDATCVAATLNRPAQAPQVVTSAAIAAQSPRP